jgi:hypothetical protein
MEERRRAKRLRAADYFKQKKKYLVQFFQVLDRLTNNPIGHLVDISTGGMMIIGKEPIKEGIILKLRIDLPEIIQESSHLSIDARCIWCRQDVNPEYYYTGFDILVISPNHAGIIEELVREIGTAESREQDTTKS